MKYVIGNWKSHASKASAEALLRGLLEKGVQSQATLEVGVCVPFPYLALAEELLAETTLYYGAQNVSPFGAGAFTGEVHAEMLADFGCRYAIVGHSERRSYFRETDSEIAAKIKQLATVGITPIWCIGETLAERQAGRWQQVLEEQLRAVLPQLTLGMNLLIAYEPVWAIGTGVNAQPSDVEAAHRWVREVVAQLGWNPDLPVLYGGSVKAANARELFAVPGCDGGLIGGASLSVSEFAAIASAAKEL